MSDDAQARRLILLFHECATQILIDIFCQDDRWTGQCTRIHQLIAGVDPVVDAAMPLIRALAHGDGADQSRALIGLRALYVDMRSKRIGLMAERAPEMIIQGREVA